MRCSFNTLSRPAALQNLSCWILSRTRLTSITGICTGSPGVELRSRCSETKFLYLSSMPGVLHSPRWLKTYKLQLHHDSLVNNNCRLVAGPCNYITLRTAPRSIHQRHNHTQNRCAGNCACAAAATIAAPIQSPRQFNYRNKWSSRFRTWQRDTGMIESASSGGSRAADVGRSRLRLRLWRSGRATRELITVVRDRKISVRRRSAVPRKNYTIRYEMLFLTCAQKLTWVSLIYCTEPATKIGIQIKRICSKLSKLSHRTLHHSVWLYDRL